MQGWKYQTKQVISKHSKMYGSAVSKPGKDRPVKFDDDSESRVPGPSQFVDLSDNAHDLPSDREQSNAPGGGRAALFDPHRDFNFDPDLEDCDFHPRDFDFSDDHGGAPTDGEEQNRPPPADEQRQQLLVDRNFRLVEPPPIQPPGADHDQEDRPSLIPPAFSEKAEVRLAYLSAVKANVFGHATVIQATEQLNNTLDCLLIAGVLPKEPRPVRSLISAKRRLGIDPDVWITPYAICPECWKHHTPAELKLLPSPRCTVPRCPGILYTEERNSKGVTVRTATKINPQTSLIGSLRRMFMRPGFAKSIRDSRGDQAGRNNDETFVMNDIHDGALWHDAETNLVREVGELGTIGSCS